MNPVSLSAFSKEFAICPPSLTEICWQWHLVLQGFKLIFLSNRIHFPSCHHEPGSRAKLEDLNRTAGKSPVC